MFFDIKYAQIYYQLYSVRTAWWRRIVSGACMIASSASLVSWVQNSDYQSLCVIFILASQVIVTLQPVFPYTMRNQAACYIHEDLTKLLREIESTWRTFSQETTDKEISEYIDRFQREYDAIENRFAKADTFPVRKRLHKKAEKEANIYFGRFNQDG